MERKLRLGVAGLGRAFQLMLPGLTAHPRYALVAAADPREEARRRFTEDFHARTYASVEELSADPSIDALYIATPHQFHATHAILAAGNAKHALVEKPMALTLAECKAMIAAARAAGVVLMIGHSHAFDAPIARARALIASGEYGALRMVTALNYTDFLYRPRRPEELDTRLGGGVLFNQAPHQVDIARLLAGSQVSRVRAIAGAWDDARPTEGAYSCLLTFESGVFASLTYSGYGHFDSDEFTGWIAESGLSKDPHAYGAARALIAGTAGREEENALKTARNYGGDKDMGPPIPGTAEERCHPHFGLVIASCEHADLRPTPLGVLIYGNHARRFESLPRPAMARAEVLDAFAAAVLDGDNPLFDGIWGLATMKVCLAMLSSARRRREIVLRPFRAD